MEGQSETKFSISDDIISTAKQATALSKGVIKSSIKLFFYPLCKNDSSG